ncbi:PhzF family phenazine biosynthesis protein [Xanthobacter variabilis]|uniref:PhzF family phenazine biosynthesis protein n=1 Tax=Xanthobacter variabilis TaxID=3119932 RepID=UPI00374E6AB5
MDVKRIAAFSIGGKGGNPAGVSLSAVLPDEREMQSIAYAVGYSETAFAAPIGDAWRVRYFAPEMEVPFCGHATIALGTLLARTHGDGVFRLHLNDGEITVEGHASGSLNAALQSPPTLSRAAPTDLSAAALELFTMTPDDLDPRLPPATVEAGARHLLLALRSRERLATMDYNLVAGAELMRAHGFATIALVQAETASLFHARNAFAAGGVFEDPATGAAAAALGGYLRDVGWPHGGRIEIVQGEDMGQPCRLIVEIPPVIGASVRVSGEARFL